MTFPFKLRFFHNLVLISLFFFFSVVSQAQAFYNIMDYGADSTAQTKSTQAIAKAIKAAWGNGGGTVFIPAGEYLTGPIHFESNITIHIDAGALLRFSDDFQDYLPMVESRYEGIDVTSFSPLFYAYKKENIAITGRGTIDGQGKKWWLTMFDLRKKFPDSISTWQEEFYKHNPNILLPDDPFMVKFGFMRPPFIQPMYCENVLIEGITIKNSPFWTVNPEFCNNVTVTGVTINNPPSPNTDGINPSSCSNVHISDCHISVGDDCITIKSGKDKPGRTKATPAQNYTITNCTMLAGHGGVVIGSEMSGDVKKIVISNCVFDGTDRGIRIKSTRGRGGVVEDIRVSNIIAKNIKKEIVKLNLFYAKGSKEPQPVTERTPKFHNIHISNVTGTAQQAVAIYGIEEMPVSNISFNNINVETEKGIFVSIANNIRFFNMQLSTEKGPAFEIENASNIDISGFSNLTPKTGEPVLKFTNVQDAFVHNCFQLVPSDVFLEVSGEKSTGIKLHGNYLKDVKREFGISEGAGKKAVGKL